MRLLLFALACLAAGPVFADNWEFLYEKEGVKVLRKKVEGSSVVAFKGEAEIEASVAKVAAVLMDVPKKLEWVHAIREARLVKQIAPLERLEYNRTHTPWPLSERDFVFHALGAVDSKRGSMEFKLRSVEEASEGPKKGIVRGEIYESGYTLEPLSGGAKTLLVATIHADPRGHLPNWVINLFQKKWPLRTILGIRAQVAKPEVKESDVVLEALKQKK